MLGRFVSSVLDPSVSKSTEHLVDEAVLLLYLATSLDLTAIQVMRTRWPDPSLF